MKEDGCIVMDMWIIILALLGVVSGRIVFKLRKRYNLDSKFSAIIGIAFCSLVYV
ncbi:hypothetical protein SAMN05428981_107204 [Bacillus sp. OV194]|nr:hypothetical protein SAMN05428981_107204 [Bacillus sp. OV194]